MKVLLDEVAIALATTPCAKLTVVIARQWAPPPLKSHLVLLQMVNKYS